MNMRTVVTGLMLAVVCASGFLTAQEKDESQSKRTEHSGSNRRAWLGVSVQDVTPRLARDRDLSVTSGALITDVLDDGPAEHGGLREGDVIVRFNGTAIADAGDLTDAVRASAPESKVAVDIQRHGEKKTMTVTVGKSPRRTFSFNMPYIAPMPHMRAIPPVPRIRVFTSHDVLGLSLNDLNRQLAEYFEAPNGKGVLVEEVERGSAGEKAGFKAGDVILTVSKEAVEDTRDFMDALDDARTGESATIGILRKGVRKDLTVPAEEISRSRSFRYHSDDGDEDDAAILGIHKEKIKHEMEHLKEQLQSVGRHIREQMEQLRQKVRKELHQVRS